MDFGSSVLLWRCTELNYFGHFLSISEILELLDYVLSWKDMELGELGELSVFSRDEATL